MAASLPHLTEAQVSALAADQSWEKGKRYFRNGAIANAAQQDQQIWADCMGTVVYRTQATLGPQGIEASSCTCPYDWGGICKHQVALLLAYIHDPDSFQAIQPLPTLLANRSREDLLKMIEEMVQRYPDLMTVVDAPKVPTLGAMPDLAKYRRQAERLFQGNEMHSMAAGLASLTDHGDRLSQSGDCLHAGDVYQLLLATANEYYDNTLLQIDYNGEIACVIQDMAAGLQDSLVNAEALDGGRRRRWVETLFETFLHDLEMGGMDYGYPAGDTLVEQTTDADWDWLEPRIQAELLKTPRNHYSDWDRRALVDLLVARAKHQGKDEQAETAILSFGAPQQKAFFHLEQGNFEQAVAIARSHFQDLPGLVNQFADALLTAGEPDRAAALVTELAQTNSKGYSYEDWFAKFYRDYGQPEQFVAAQSELLKTRFTLKGYQDLQAQAEPLGQWEAIRQSLLTNLEAKNGYSQLIEIALWEKDWEMALYNLRQIRAGNRTAHQERVAKAIQADQPGTAIALYQELIAAAINQRGRDNYRQAAQYLQAIRPLCTQLGRAEEFQGYVEQVRSQNTRLPALQQELDKAGL